MKKENIITPPRGVKQLPGLEGNISATEPPLDIGTLKHQRFTDKIMDTADYSGLVMIYGGSLVYGIYKAATKVPEIANQVVDQLGIVCSDIYQYIGPFISS